MAATYLNMCMYEMRFERLTISKFYFQVSLFYKEGLESNSLLPTDDDGGNHTLREMVRLYIVYLEHAVFNTNDKKNLHKKKSFGRR